jgi:dienelactone hydrolase
MKFLLLLASLVPSACSTPPQGPVIGRDVDYVVNGKTMQGYWSVPAETESRRPTILIIHDWNGIDAYERMRADMIAGLGYNAFCVDIYGKGVRPKNSQESGAEAGKYYADQALLLERAKGGLDFVKKQELAVPSEIAAMGYCFGGMTALEMARAGFDLKAVVSFHGSLATKNPLRANKFRGKALVLHGEADPVVSKADVDALKAEMAGAKVDFKFISYPDALHSFTIKGGPVSPATKYDENADKGSWQEMKSLYESIFK